MLVPRNPQPHNGSGRRARFADFEVDPRAGELRQGSRLVRLQEKPLQVLRALLEHPGEVVSREELRSRLWPGDTFVDFENNLNTAVSKLREALGETAEAPRLLETLPKRGYRLAVTVRWHEPGTADRGLKLRWVAYAAAAGLATTLAFLYTARSLRGPGEPSTTARPEAYEAFSQGRYLARQGGDGIVRSQSYFRRAIDLDPRFALAHLALSQTLFTFRERPLEVVPQAMAAAERALTLDGDLAGAYHRRGELRFYFDWDWEGARRDLEEAIRLNPNVGAFHRSYAGYFSMLGRHDEALAEISRAIALDPAGAAVQADAGWYFFTARRYDEALRFSRKALELEPEHPWAQVWVVLSHAALGDLELARAWADRMMSAENAAPHLRRELNGAGDNPLRAFWRWQELEQARQSVAEYISPADRALVAVELGERARALDLLEEAQRERAGWVLPFLKVYPQLDMLREEPRFRALVQKMRYPA